ncbi:MAG: hypothetical protein LBQ31_01360 [Bacteroidales bacterium]|nr:hypothetical protein [Bacteroidales bacterium]
MSAYPAGTAAGHLPVYLYIYTFHPAINHLYVYLFVYLSGYPYGCTVKIHCKGIYKKWVLLHVFGECL